MATRADLLEAMHAVDGSRAALAIGRRPHWPAGAPSVRGRPKTSIGFRDGSVRGRLSSTREPEPCDECHTRHTKAEGCFDGRVTRAVCDVHGDEHVFAFVKEYADGQELWRCACTAEALDAREAGLRIDAEDESEWEGRRLVACVAAIEEGFDFVGCELDEYTRAIAEARCIAAQPSLFGS